MIAKKLKSSRKFRAFLIALLLSAFLWFTSHLSGKFNVNISVDVHIKNIPEYYNTNHFPDTSLKLEISGSGFVLLRYYLKDKTIVELDFNHLKKLDSEDKHNFYIQKADLIKAIQNELPGNITITEFDYSNLLYSITSYPKKMVPVIAKVSYNCADGYMVLGKITLEPDSVILEGPSKTIRLIDSVLSIPVELKDLKDSTNINIKLQIKENDAWMFSQDNVNIHIPVTKVKRMVWTESFQTEVNGTVYQEEIRIEAWVPVYINDVKTRIKHRITDNEIMLTPEISTPCKVIGFSPSSISLIK